MGDATQIIAGWRAEAEDQAYFSASRVQDRLFDLYSEVQESPAGRLVETWLTLTIQRDLFSGDEVLAFLEQVEAHLHPVNAG